MTPERERMLAALMKARAPISSKDLHDQLAGSMDRVTVYRNLETFVDAGLVRRVDVGHRHAHYEAVGETDHHHLICSSCGLIEDVAYCPPAADVARVLERSKAFASIDRHALEFYGTCAACAKKRK